MADIQNDALTTLESIVRPPCAKCGAKTWLTKLDAWGESGCDLRTFECAHCEAVEIKIVRQPLAVA